MNTLEAHRQLEGHLAGEKAESTIQAYRVGTRRFIHSLIDDGDDMDSAERDTVDVDLQAVTKADIKLHLRDMTEDGYAPNTVKLGYAGIDALFEAIRPDDNPAEGINPSQWPKLKGDSKKKKILGQRPQYLTAEEVEQLAENVWKPSLRNELIVRLIFTTGMRRDELVKLKIRHVNTDRRSIYVVGKGEKERTVYYPDTLDTLLQIWLRDRESMVYSDSPYLFPTNESEHISSKQVGNIILDAAENAGLQEVLYTDKNGNERKKVTVHTLRHSFAVHCLKKGMPTALLKKAMGHANIETTEVYLDWIDTDVEDGMRRWGPR
jgi:integrase/recombinase XerD